MMRSSLLIITVALASLTLGFTSAPQAKPADTEKLDAVLKKMDAAAASFHNAQAEFEWDSYEKVIDEIEKAADVVVWCCDEAPGFTPGRAQDKAFVGNIVQAIEAYASGALGEADISLHAVDRVIAIGSDGMMAAVALLALLLMNQREETILARLADAAP